LAAHRRRSLTWSHKILHHHKTTHPSPPIPSPWVRSDFVQPDNRIPEWAVPNTFQRDRHQRSVSMDRRDANAVFKTTTIWQFQHGTVLSFSHKRQSHLPLWSCRHQLQSSQLHPSHLLPTTVDLRSVPFNVVHLELDALPLMFFHRIARELRLVAPETLLRTGEPKEIPASMVQHQSMPTLTQFPRQRKHPLVRPLGRFFPRLSMLRAAQQPGQTMERTAPGDNAVRIT